MIKQDSHRGSDRDAKSWRSIKQSAGRKKGVTSLARKRRRKAFLKVSGIGLALLSITSVFAYGVYLFQQNQSQGVAPGLFEPIRQITFQTDGVLTSAWCQTLLSLARGTGMMEVDIIAIKNKLEKHGQVKSATVIRRFPDQLRIVVKEREPVLRARVATKKGGFKQLLIARDGVVYEGNHYPKATLNQLPFYSGGRFIRYEGRIKPLSGMEKIASLLTLARINFPHIYGLWQIVSWESVGHNWEAPEAIIRVKSRDIKEILFAPDNFEGQLAQLAQIIEHAQYYQISALKRVDLSPGKQVVVQYFPKLFPRRFEN